MRHSHDFGKVRKVYRGKVEGRSRRTPGTTGEVRAASRPLPAALLRELSGDPPRSARHLALIILLAVLAWIPVAVIAILIA